MFPCTDTGTRVHRRYLGSYSTSSSHCSGATQGHRTEERRGSTGSERPVRDLRALHVEDVLVVVVVVGPKTWKSMIVSKKLHLWSVQSDPSVHPTPSLNTSPKSVRRGPVPRPLPPTTTCLTPREFPNTTLTNT